MKTNRERLEFIKNQLAEPTEPVIAIDRNLFVGVVTLNNGAVLGNDGLGFEWDGCQLVKFPHHGNVCIGKDVEIGANTCIDRSTMPNTWTVIGEGTKIDNMVHIGHNCKIGPHNVICAGAIFSGGVETGKCVYVGVGAMIKQKVKIGENVNIGMGAVILNDIPDEEPDNDKYWWVGNPARRINTEEKES